MMVSFTITGGRGGDITGLQRYAVIRIIGVAKVCQEVNHTGFRETLNRNRLTEAFEWRAGHSVQSYQEESGSDDVNDPLASTSS